MSTRYWPGVGAVTAIGTGLWMDQVGNIHVATDEVLRSIGAEASLKNRRIITDHIAKQWGNGQNLPMLSAIAGNPG